MEKIGTQVYFFDTSGLLTKLETIDTTGFLSGEFHFVANKQKGLVARFHNDFKSGKSDTVYFFKEYKNGHLIKDSATFFPISYHYEYDKKGNLIKYIIHSNYGPGFKSKRETLYTRDNNRKLINVKESIYIEGYHPGGNTISDRDIIYNLNGKVEKEIEKINCKNGFCNNEGSFFYEYDKGDILTRLTINTDDSVQYDFNEKGLVTSLKLVLMLEDKKLETIDRFIYTYRKD